MGTSATPTELAAKLDRYAVTVGNANATAISAAALMIKETTTPLVAAATGGDMRISGVTTKVNAGSVKAAGNRRQSSSNKVGVRYTVKGREHATAIIRAVGPAQLIERDVKPHTVASRYAPRSVGKTRAARLAGVKGDVRGQGWTPRAVIHFGSVYARYAIKSGGSRGRHPFERGFAEGARRSPAVFAAEQRKALTSIFR